MENPNEPKQISELIIKVLMSVANSTDPTSFKAFFIGGILANVVGNMPEEYWTEFKIVKPCGQPGCDCHALEAQLMPALERLREDWNKVTKG